MTELARCDCCDLPVESCGKAAEQHERRQQSAQRVLLLHSGWVPAQWAGSCGQCGERFEPLTPIRRGVGGGFVAECCA